MNLPWPNGYGALASWSALGVSGPTLFVVAPDGRIAWHDNSSRWFHDSATLCETLDRAIADALTRPRE